MKKQKNIHDLKFFTNPLDDWPYHLIPYHKWRGGYPKTFELLIIDSGVNTLKKKEEYEFIEEYPLLDLEENIYWVIPDYPYDILKDCPHKISQKECIKRTWRNIERWHSCPQSIPSVQHEYEEIDSFKENYDRLYPLTEIMGIGNICKSRKMSFLKKLINYINLNNPKKKWIHFFGLYKLAIKYLLSVKPSFPFSVDSMNWDYGLFNSRENDSKDHRWDVKFREYIEEIKSWEAFYQKQKKIIQFL